MNENNYDYTELNKLEEYLSKRKKHYHRIPILDGQQIVVMNKSGKVIWDAVIHFGSYGHEKGLLEIMGAIVDSESVGDTVLGNLTSDKIIELIERCEMTNKKRKKKYSVSDFTPENLITSLDELMSQEFVLFRGTTGSHIKLIHIGWFQGWQLKYASNLIRDMRLYKLPKESEENNET